MELQIKIWKNIVYGLDFTLMDLQKIHQNVAEGQDKSSQWTREKLEKVQIMDGGL